MREAGTGRIGRRSRHGLIPKSDASAAAPWLHEDMQAQAVPSSGTWYLSRRWFLDPIGMALLSIMLGALGFRGLWGQFSILESEISSWWAVALALPACALALAKNRAPMRVLVAVGVLFFIDVLTVGGVGTLLVVLDVLWTAVFVAAPRTRRIIQILLVALTVGAFATALTVAQAPLSFAFLIAVQFGAIFGTDYWWAVAVSQAQELAELHRLRAETAERESERDRAEAVRSEREMMARELHDAIAGHVMAMAIRAEAALSTEADESRDRAALQAVRDAGLDAHVALRTMISVLRSGDGELVSPPRWEDLDGIVEHARVSGLEILFQRTAERFPALVEQTIVRIVREALANSIRHASGASVTVDIAARDTAADVRIESFGGSPIAHAAGNGWGLRMLEERVRALDGTFRAGPADGGWIVSAELPVGVRA